MISIISSNNYDHTLGEKNDIKNLTITTIIDILTPLIVAWNINNITTITNILYTLRKQNFKQLK